MSRLICYVYGEGVVRHFVSTLLIWAQTIVLCKAASLHFSIGFYAMIYNIHFCTTCLPVLKVTFSPSCTFSILPWLGVSCIVIVNSETGVSGSVMWSSDWPTGTLPPWDTLILGLAVPNWGGMLLIGIRRIENFCSVEDLLYCPSVTEMKAITCIIVLSDSTGTWRFALKSCGNDKIKIE